MTTKRPVGGDATHDPVQDISTQLGNMPSNLTTMVDRAQQTPPPHLIDAINESVHLRNEYRKLAAQVDPDVERGEEQPIPDKEAYIKLATLGIQWASARKKTARVQRAIVLQHQAAGATTPENAEGWLKDIEYRDIFAGQQLFRNLIRKRSLEEPGSRGVWLTDLAGNPQNDALAIIGKPTESFTTRHKRLHEFRQITGKWYKGPDPDKTIQWCHITARWFAWEDVKAFRLVPDGVDPPVLGRILFGSRSEALDKPGNALLMAKFVKKWFEKSMLVVVPVDPTESPIKRWRTETLCDNINDKVYCGITWIPYSEFRQRELEFYNEKRPVPRFLYFRFVMTLIRVRDLNRPNWQQLWARYFEQPPFPKAKPFMRQAMLRCLATAFQVPAMDMVESWLSNNCFVGRLQLSDAEVEEATRLVHLMSRAPERETGVWERRKSKKKGKAPDSDSEAEEEQDSLDELFGQDMGDLGRGPGHLS